MDFGRNNIKAIINEEECYIMIELQYYISAILKLILILMIITYYL